MPGRCAPGCGRRAWSCARAVPLAATGSGQAHGRNPLPSTATSGTPRCQRSYLLKKGEVCFSRPVARRSMVVSVVGAPGAAREIGSLRLAVEHVGDQVDLLGGTR